jgi:hypothetical protein
VPDGQPAGSLLILAALSIAAVYSCIVTCKQTTACLPAGNAVVQGECDDADEPPNEEMEVFPGVTLRA